jgi:hypothetical protein
MNTAALSWSRRAPSRSHCPRQHPSGHKPSVHIDIWKINKGWTIIWVRQTEQPGAGPGVGSAMPTSGGGPTTDITEATASRGRNRGHQMLWPSEEEINRKVRTELEKILSAVNSLDDYLHSLNSARPPGTRMAGLGNYLLCCCSVREALGECVSETVTITQRPGSPVRPLPPSCS